MELLEKVLIMYGTGEEWIPSKIEENVQQKFKEVEF